MPKKKTEKKKKKKRKQQQHVYVSKNKTCGEGNKWADWGLNQQSGFHEVLSPFGDLVNLVLGDVVGVPIPHDSVLM